MRFQPTNQLPDDEINIFWYRIIKPLIVVFGTKETEKSFCPMFPAQSDKVDKKF